jgi:uncharacterized membrane protein YgaE (UPF0421/DUF939 family)
MRSPRNRERVASLALPNRTDIAIPPHGGAPIANNFSMEIQVDWRTFIVGLQLAIRAATAGSLAVIIAELFTLEQGIIAFTAAIITTDLDRSQCRQLGVRRLVATAVGAVCGAVLSPLLSDRPLTVALSVFVTMLICHLLRAHDGAKIAGFVCGIIVLAQDSDPWRYALFRSIDTGLGVVLAWLISYVPKLFRVDEPESKE